MSTRSPIQVPEELKNEVEGLKDELRCKTSYEVIEKLTRHYEAGKVYRIEQVNKWQAEKERQAAEMLQLDEKTKKEFEALKVDVGLQADSSLVTFLMLHYLESPNVGKSAFEAFKKLK
jgi:hypothetical protein